MKFLIAKFLISALAFAYGYPWVCYCCSTSTSSSSSSSSSSSGSVSHSSSASHSSSSSNEKSDCVDCQGGFGNQHCIVYFNEPSSQSVCCNTLVRNGKYYVLDGPNASLQGNAAPTISATFCGWNLSIPFTDPRSCFGAPGPMNIGVGIAYDSVAHQTTIDLSIVTNSIIQAQANWQVVISGKVNCFNNTFTVTQYFNNGFCANPLTAVIYFL